MKWLVVSVCLIAISSGAEEGTWFTKSLDNFSPEKCSPLDKSQIVGGFYTCLNGAGKSESGQQPQKNSWGSFGTGSLKSGALSFNSFKKNQGGDKKVNGPAKGSQKTAAGDSRETSDWPLSMNKSLSAIIACMPKLTEKKCLTPTEVDFFQKFQKIFEIQKNVSSEYGKNVAEDLAKTQCTKKKNVDVNTQCFSRIVSQYQWFGWKMNWKDGKICKFVSQLGACEAAAYGSCPVTVASFVPMLWKKSLAETPCANMNLSSVSGGDVMTGYLGYSNYFNSKSDVSGYWGGFNSKLPNQNSENRAPMNMQGSISRKSGSDDAEEGRGTRYNFFDRETNESQEDESQEDFRAASSHHHRRRDQVHGKQGQFNQESKYYRQYNQVRHNQEDSNDSNEQNDSNEKDQTDENRDSSHGDRQNHRQQKQQNEEDFWKQRRGNQGDFERQDNRQERNPRRRNHQQQDQSNFWKQRRHNQEDDYDHRNGDNDRTNDDERQKHNHHREENEEDFWRRRRPQGREEEEEKERENREREVERLREMMKRRREEEENRRREEERERRERERRRQEAREHLERERQRREKEARERAQNQNQIDDQNDQDDHTKLQQCLRMLNTLPFSYSVSPRFEPFRGTQFRNWPNYH
ncbi:uncharacterized protein LOC141851776 [Brevipalpus obovatus]|uniref:uncharacterized protein LOC141851776 n=1 Tax=Brevipalpus obovatus TaxID=246614 RepID=UPI003D9E0F72